MVYIDDETHARFDSTELQEDDVLLNITGASIGRSAMADERVAGGNVNQHVCIIRLDATKVVARFVNCLLSSSLGQGQIESFQAGGNRQGLNFGQIRSIQIPLPPTKVEQDAIATVLSDMDAEISALEAKLTKIHQLKTGMMQELLTGKIRLVRSAASAVPFTVEQKVVTSLRTAHNPQINEAVVIAAMASEFGSEEYPLARVRRTKLTYLLHRHVEHEAKGFLKKAAGPYNPQTRYGGPENIALKNRYVRSHHNGKYEGFVAADNISQAMNYFEQWYGSPVLEWMEQFRFKSTEELELLSTVDMASEDLLRDGKAVTFSRVKQVLSSNTEWKAKLDRPIFSDGKIVAAIQMCQQLFAPESDTA
jgi:hypothetical protein